METAEGKGCAVGPGEQAFWRCGFFPIGKGIAHLPQPKPPSLPAPQDLFPSGRPIAITADAMVTILFPEDTFVPRSLRGIASSITEARMDWLTYQLSSNQVRQIQGELHYAKVALELPVVPGAIRLKAVVVSVQYQLRTTTDPARTTLGLQFVPDGGREGLEQLHHALEKIRASAYKVKAVAGRTNKRLTGILPRKLS